MIRKILVSVDGSEHADRALDFALDLAQKYSSEILILTVVNYDMAFASDDPRLFEVYKNGVDVFHKKVLSDALEKAKKIAPNLTVAAKLMEGHPADKIIETAEKENYDLIVMGRRGRGHLTHMLLGSVSDRVADLSPCALLLIK
jgi:nucleotide-binding universal stress UspA family protein